MSVENLEKAVSEMETGLLGSGVKWSVLRQEIRYVISQNEILNQRLQQTAEECRRLGEVLKFKDKEIKRMQRQKSALRGVITRLKNK